MNNLAKSIKVLTLVVNLILGDNFTSPIEKEMLKRPDSLYPY
jgi:hypothetical protein